MRPGIRFQAYLVAAIPLIFLVAVLALALLIQWVSAEGNASEEQTQQILRQVDKTEQLLSQAGRSAVSYTGPADEAKLGGFRSARSQLPAAFESLGEMTAGEPGIPEQVAALRAASNDGMALLSRYIDALRAGHVQQARALDNAPSTRALSVRLAASASALVTAQRNYELARLGGLRHRVLRYEYALITLSVIAIVLTLFTTGRFGFGLVQRVRRLAHNAELLAAQRPAQPLEGNDEFADLDRVYRAMMQRIAHEQRIAATLQRALLPQTLPVTPGVRIDSAYVPAADDMEVGGDWYDVFPLSQRKLCVSVGDVAGHGLRAAALMAVSRIAVRTAARVDERPAEILRYVNRVVCADEPNTLVTAFVGVLDVTTGKFTFATAGHPPPLMISPDETARYLDLEGGFVLGADAHAEFEERSSTLSEGCALVVYTDGVVEVDRDYAKGQNDLMNASLSEYVESPGNIAEAILRRVMGTKRALDDAAIVFIGISQLSGEASRRAATWKLDARDQASAHRVKRAMLWQLGQSINGRQDLSGVELIFGELLGNVARHTPGAAEVALEYRDGQALLHICDEGLPFIMHRNGTPDLLSEGGRGLMIAQSLSDGLSIERTETGNRVTAVLPVTTA